MKRAFLAILLFAAAPAFAQQQGGLTAGNLGQVTLPPLSVIGNSLSIGGNAVAVSFAQLNAGLALAVPMAPFTLKGNPTAVSAASQDISIPALPQKVSPAAGDRILIADSANSNALSYALVAAVASAGSVGAIDAKTGSFTTGGGLTSTAGNIIKLANNGATLQASPSNPGGFTSVSFVMMGFGGPCNFTPAYSGRLKVEFFGDVTNNTGGNITNLNIRYGTGIPPSFNAVATGTVAIGNSPAVGHPTANSLSMFALSAVITGLTPGTHYWLDMVGSTNANTSTISNVSCNAMEF